MLFARTTEITLSTLLSAFREVKLNDPHPMFGFGTRYVPESLAGELADEARDELLRLGLLERGRVSDAFEDALYTLARPETEYVARVDNQGEQYSVFVGTRGQGVVTAVHDGARVLVKASGSRETPAAALVARLPRFRPAKLALISLSQHEFRGEDSDFPDERGRSARAVDELLNRPAFGRGEINVSLRGAGRSRRVADGVLTYRDLSAGRVAFEVSGAERNRYITVMAGDDQMLVQRVAALRASLDG
ncbi:ESX secretion-associated protein EspG [Amycolatopsis rubida]|uniref:EspG family protein n=1 Tax=Amycolatopsis rubida TaxID=112413 RepID=A0A1I5NZF2_9PSEU|nr:ESX secretion-associated protein EspG [Amycolatopsis rubida]SFP27184.1 EspG family protein [Amycolatopsis rubida]